VFLGIKIAFVTSLRDETNGEIALTAQLASTVMLCLKKLAPINRSKSDLI
jgi:hypothetical protein